MDAKSIDIEVCENLQRTKYSVEDKAVLENIINEFEGGWISRELSLPNNGVSIREKRVWPKIAAEFNRVQGRQVTADQLRKRWNCNKSNGRKKPDANTSTFTQAEASRDAVEFVKATQTDVHKDIDQLFASPPSKDLSNKRADYFFSKSNLEVRSTWAALYQQTLKELIQARYLLEDGLFLLMEFIPLIECEYDTRTSQGENSLKDLDQQSESPDLCAENGESKRAQVTSVQLIKKKLVESIKSYTSIEQFVEKSIVNEIAINSHKYFPLKEQSFGVLDKDIDASSFEFDNLHFENNVLLEQCDAIEEETSHDAQLTNLDVVDNPQKNKDKRRRIQNPRYATSKKETKDETGLNCEHCGKFFSEIKNLRAHLTSHTGKHRFECEECDKSFQYKSQYETHTRKHSGDRPFRCHVCAAGFTQRNVLIDHIRIHTGEKPFKCDHCDLTFSQKSNLRSHMSIHSGLRPFQCDSCSKSFRLKDSLIEHKSVHTGIKAFKCDQCPKEFRIKAKLKKHILKLHNVTILSKL